MDKAKEHNSALSIGGAKPVQTEDPKPEATA